MSEEEEEQFEASSPPLLLSSCFLSCHYCRRCCANERREQQTNGRRGVRAHPPLRCALTLRDSRPVTRTIAATKNCRPVTSRTGSPAPSGLPFAAASAALTAGASLLLPLTSSTGTESDLLETVVHWGRGSGRESRAGSGYAQSGRGHARLW